MMSYLFVISADSINFDVLDSGFLSSAEKLFILISKARKQTTEKR